MALTTLSISEAKPIEPTRRAPLAHHMNIIDGEPRPAVFFGKGAFFNRAPLARRAWLKGTMTSGALVAPTTGAAVLRSCALVASTFDAAVLRFCLY